MLVIGRAGGSGSGKTTVVKKITQQLPKDSVTVLSQDSYYFDNKNLSDEEKKRINFDHPDSIEWNLLIDHLNKLNQGEIIQSPVYSYLNCSRLEETISKYPKKVVIVEGILIFTNQKLRKKLDLKVFVSAESDDRLMRILDRDMKERGRSLNQVIEHYENFVKPMHLQFIEPTKRHADIIIPQGGQNLKGIDVLMHKIKASIL
jgi:uridine kinase